MDTHDYVRNEERSPSITVGSVSISLKLEVITPRPRKAVAEKPKPRLKLTIGRHETSYGAWEDSDDGTLESQIQSVVVAILRSAETHLRAESFAHHRRLIERKERIEEELCKEAEERALQARELLEQQAQQRVDRLLGQAEALDQAEKIRQFVGKVRSRKTGSTNGGDIVEKWARWALAEADLIDPVVNGDVSQSAAEIASLSAESFEDP